MQPGHEPAANAVWKFAKVLPNAEKAVGFQIESDKTQLYHWYVTAPNFYPAHAQPVLCSSSNLELKILGETQHCPPQFLYFSAHLAFSSWN